MSLLIIIEGEEDRPDFWINLSALPTDAYLHHLGTWEQKQKRGKWHQACPKIRSGHLCSPIVRNHGSIYAYFPELNGKQDELHIKCRFKGSSPCGIHVYVKRKRKLLPSFFGVKTMPKDNALLNLLTKVKPDYRKCKSFTACSNSF